ncbi:hypothetical protein ACO0QE_002716 [Hanseniaspora vineae]
MSTFDFTTKLQKDTPHSNPGLASLASASKPEERTKQTRNSNRPPSLRRHSSSLSFKKYHASDDENEFHEEDALLTVPFIDSSVDPSLPTKYLKQDIVSCIEQLRIPKWGSKISQGKFDIKKLKLNKISGAMTNAIFKVEYNRLPSLLLRIYGPNVDTIIDREYELKVLARLSLKDIGPKLYGCFANGRFEEFLENSTTLSRNDIRDWKTSARIARRMKELHAHVPLTKNEKQGTPISWKKVSQWLQVLQDSKWDQLEPEKFAKVFSVPTLQDLKDVIGLYEKWIKENDDSELCFCHNDAQYGNLLFTSPKSDFIAHSTSASESVQENANELSAPPSSSAVSDAPPSESSSASLFPVNSNISVDSIINVPSTERLKDNRLVVIDFEYSGPNPAALDLANHLSEWMHDYHCENPHLVSPKNYPNKEQVLNFLYSYCAGGKTRRGSFNEQKSHKNDLLSPFHKLSIDETDMNEQVVAMYNSIIKWRPMVQLFWALWGVLQSGELEAAAANEQSKVVHGPDGQYIISEFKEQSGETNVFSSSDSDNDVDEEGKSQDQASKDTGTNIDTFNYLEYSHGKLDIFYADLINLGIVDSGKIIHTKEQFPSLDTEYLHL